MDKILAKNNFPQWLKKLDRYRIYAPRFKDEVWNYELVSDSVPVRLDHTMTAVPAKKIVFPQRETYFEFRESDENGLELKERLPEEKPAVILGARPCEGKALLLTDKVFGGEIEDPYYWARRKATTLVGLACGTPPSANCFCPSVGGSPHSREGLDLLLTDLGDRYFVESLTDKGRRWWKPPPPSSPTQSPRIKKAFRKSMPNPRRRLNGSSRISTASMCN